MDKDNEEMKVIFPDGVLFHFIQNIYMKSIPTVQPFSSYERFFYHRNLL